MLYITSNIRSREEVTREWRVGDRPFYPPMVYGVDEVQADGDELSYILSYFRNIPSSDKSVIVWRGETARFIVSNLK